MNHWELLNIGQISQDLFVHSLKFAARLGFAALLNSINPCQWHLRFVSLRQAQKIPPSLPGIREDRFYPRGPTPPDMPEMVAVGD